MNGDLHCLTAGWVAAGPDSWVGWGWGVLLESSTCSSPQGGEGGDGGSASKGVLSI